MDSEDDMHDAYDVESLDEDFYSGGTPMGSEDGDADYDFVDNESEDSEDITSHRQQAMRVCKEEAVWILVHKQLERIQETTNYRGIQ